ENDDVEFRTSNCDGILKAEKGRVLADSADKIGGVLAGLKATLTRIMNIEGDVQATGDVETNDMASRGNIVSTEGNIIFNNSNCAGQLRADRGDVVAQGSDNIGSVQAGKDVLLTRVAMIPGTVEAGNTLKLDDSTVWGRATSKGNMVIEKTDVGNL